MVAQQTLTWIYLALQFLLMVGLGASVNWETFKSKFRKPKGVLVGVTSQFLLMPAIACGLAYMTVGTIGPAPAVALIILCSCPGGSASNMLTWIVDADFSLSVAMTAASSLLSIGMMPLNAYIYTRPIIDESIKIDVWGIVISSSCVLLGTTLGIWINYKQPTWHKVTEPLALLAAIAVLCTGFLQSSLSGAPIWAQHPLVYAIVAIPIFLGLTFGVGVALLLKLEKPSAVAVGFDTSVQNIMVAIPVLNMTFEDPIVAATSIAVPLLYSTIALFTNFLFMVIFWKCGWTNADPSVPARNLLCLVYKRYKEIPKPVTDAGPTKCSEELTAEEEMEDPEIDPGPGQSSTTEDRLQWSSK